MGLTSWPVRAGHLLVAAPALADPNFRRSVVLVVEHEPGQGSLGVVLNRPTEVPVDRVLGTWGELATSPPVVFSGGPVARDSALALAQLPGNGNGEVHEAGWHPLEDSQPAMSRIGLVDLDAPAELVAPAVTRLRVFAGYAGWEAGQLRSEIAEGAWYVFPGEPDDAFAAEPSGLMARVFHRQGGELAYLATYPDDPTKN